MRGKGKAPGPDPGRTAESPGSIRRELLLSTSVLFLAAILVAVASAGIVIPLAPSTLSALITLTLIVLAELGILYLYLRTLMDRTVLRPVERIVVHAERIADGELQHRIPPEASEELNRIVDAVNSLAGRLIREQELLATNVRSLNDTNRELTATTAELVRAARLASVGTLSAGVAHEIGNPLGALRGYLDVIRNRAEDPDQVRQILTSAGSEVERIDAIIRHILDFGRPTVRTGALPRSDAGEAIERVVEVLVGRGELEREWIRVRAEGGLPRVRAHSQHLDRILINLLRNAVQATGPGVIPEVGVVLHTVAAQREPVPRRTDDPPTLDYSHRRRLGDLLRVRAPAPPDAGDRDVVLEVEDRGEGIPPEVLPLVFDPFFTSREPGKGIGMGLALTARIVGELGGTIEAENREEGGALFRVTLPGVEVEDEAGGAAESPAPAPTRREGTE